MDFQKLSEENLIKIQKVLKVIFDCIELTGYNRLTGAIQVPMKGFEREGFYYEEIKMLLRGLDPERKIITIDNDFLNAAYRNLKSQMPYLDTEGQDSIFFQTHRITKEVLDNYFSFSIHYLYVLKKRREEIDNFLSKKDQKTIKITGDNKITKITIVKMNNGKKLVAVNDVLKETKGIKDSSEWWQIFVKEIEERDMTNKTNEKGIPEDMKSCFNYNIQKCPLLYRGGKYTLTNIFTGSGIDTIINPDVKTETLTEKQYLTRIKRKKKK